MTIGSEAGGTIVARPGQSEQSERVGRAVFVGLALLAPIVLLYLSRGLTFWQDEWGLIQYSGGLADIFRPLNEHWSTIPILLYRGTFSLFGLHLYLPYEAEVIGLHLVAVAAAWVLCRRRGGALVATLVSIPLLFLGSGAENLFWAFQTGFVGSVAFGLWGLVLLERSGRVSLALASAFLIAALMSSGMGLVMLAGAVTFTVVEPTLRRRAIATVPPIVAYGVWFITVGRSGMNRPEGFAGPAELASFLLRGIGHAAGSFTGLEAAPSGDRLALALFIAACVGTLLLALRSPRRPALAAAMLTAIVVEYGIIGLTRATVPGDFATRSRYVYVAAFLLILAVVDWIPTLRITLGANRRLGMALVAVGCALLAGTVLANVVALRAMRTTAEAHADLTRAEIAFAVSPLGDAPWVDPAGRLLGMPDNRTLRDLVDHDGSPLEDPVVPAKSRAPSAAAREMTLLRMIGDAFRVEPANTAVTSRSVPEVIRLDGVRATIQSGCLSVDRVAAPGTITVRLPPGARLRIASDAGFDGQVSLGHGEPPSRTIDLRVPPGRPSDVVVPDLGDGSAFTLRVSLGSAAGQVDLCQAPGQPD